MNIKVLYVEDELFLGRIVKESLESRQFNVKMVADGNSVLKEFESFLPDICVLDVMLPGKDGYTLAREIRSLSQVPIIFVTAKIQTDELITGFEVGGNDYIRKPFSMEELIVRIQNLLQLSNRQKANVSDTVRIGDYEFTPHRYELRFRETCKKLSHREATLLQMLIDNKNSTVLRKDILLKLWGDDSFFNSRNLDVYITKLRDYFKGDKNVQIITIKGIGYHFTVG